MCDVKLYIDWGCCVCVCLYKNVLKIHKDWGCVCVHVCVCVRETERVCVSVCQSKTILHLFKSVYRLRLLCVCVSLLEQREREEHEEGSEEREEGQDSPIPSGDDIHLYGNQTHQGGTGQWICVFVSEMAGWDGSLDPELLISSGDAQVSRSAVTTATVSGVRWLRRGTPPTHQTHMVTGHLLSLKTTQVFSFCLHSVQQNVIKGDNWKKKNIHFNLLICNPNNCYENPEKHNFKCAKNVLIIIIKFLFFLFVLFLYI